jgi:predicted nucleic acid-binding protein
MVCSTQVMNEFYNAATRLNRPPSLSHEQAAEILRDLVSFCTILPITLPTVFRAHEAIRRYRMSLWDALIWATAREYGITLIYTEDRQSAPEIEGVRYVNPFVETGE